jgi:hypothetical protein
MLLAIVFIQGAVLNRAATVRERPGRDTVELIPGLRGPS